MLSEREQQILCLVAEGLSNRQIAGQLDISENTVKVHVRNIFAKINVSSRTEASLYAVRAGLIAVPQRPIPQTNDPTPVSDDVPQASESPEGDGDGVILDDTPGIPRATLRDHRSRSWGVRAAVGVAIALGFGIGYWQFRKLPEPIPAPRVVDVRWQQLPAVPTPRAHVLLVVVDGTLYAMGGGDSDASQRTVQRYDDKAHAWVGAPDLPFALAHGAAWSDGSGVWLIDAQKEAQLRHWDGTRWTAVTMAPKTVTPTQIVRWQGQSVVLGSDGTNAQVWTYNRVWEQLAPLPAGVDPASVIVNAESLLIVAVSGDVYEYRAGSMDWRLDGNIGHRWQGSVAASVLGALLVIQSDTTPVMTAYSVGQGVVGQQNVPEYVQAGVQIVPWQMQLVISDATGSHLAMYQALYQNFAPIAQ